MVAVCDADKPAAYDDLVAENPDAALRWANLTDWEGVISAEGDIEAIAGALEVSRSALGTWDQHQAQLRDFVIRTVGESDHVAAAADIPSLLAGYDEGARRQALAELLRGNSGIDFKSAIDGRLVAEALPDVPPTIVRMMEIVHSVADGTQRADRSHNL